MTTDRSEGQDAGALMRGCYAQLLDADKDLKVLRAASTQNAKIPLRASQHARNLLGLTGTMPVWRDTTHTQPQQAATGQSASRGGGGRGGRGGRGGGGNKRQNSGHEDSW